jgi:4-hydroxy-tetrahydrodipicolinate synthase
VYAALLTFYDDEHVDLDAVGEHAARLVEAGVRGIVTGGSTGEFHLLADDERRAVLETVRAAVPDVPVVVQVGAPTTRASCALADHAAANGAAGLLVITPYYGQLGPEPLADHLRAIGAVAPQLPTLAYSMPRLAGYDFPLELVLRLAQEGVLAGSKESGGDLARMLDLLAGAPEGYAAFSGAVPLLAASVLAGGHGGVLAAANAVPEALVALEAAAAAGDAERAFAVTRSLAPLLAAMAAAAPGPGGIRAAAAERYGRSAGTRRPLPPPDAAARRRVAEALAGALAAVPC